MSNECEEASELGSIETSTLSTGHTRSDETAPHLRLWRHVWGEGGGRGVREGIARSHSPLEARSTLFPRARSDHHSNERRSPMLSNFSFLPLSARCALSHHRPSRARLMVNVLPSHACWPRRFRHQNIPCLQLLRVTLPRQLPFISVQRILTKLRVPLQYACR
jgi:hypothetical protein